MLHCQAASDQLKPTPLTSEVWLYTSPVLHRAFRAAPQTKEMRQLNDANEAQPPSRANRNLVNCQRASAGKKLR